jgi:hypothetical protein
MRRGDVGHVERRILAQQHNVHARKVDLFLRPELEMVALDIAQDHRLGDRLDDAVAHRQLVRRVVKQLVAARLRFQRHGEGGIAADLDRAHMVHLDRDILDLAHG